MNASGISSGALLHKGNNMSAIIVGVDHSETAHLAAVRAAELATALDKPLHLVMAVKSGKSHSRHVGGDQFFDDWVTNANQFLQTMKAELGVENTTTALGGTDPAKSLCDEATRLDASMIVVGNKRVQGAKRVLGSVAAAVTHHAPCDVLVAHTIGNETATADKPVRHSITSATIFQGCSTKQLSAIDALGTSISVDAGQKLTMEGRSGREFGVLLDGSATVTIDGREVAKLGPGDHFGAMALFASVGDSDSTRSATVTADSDMWISMMSVTEFSSLTSQFPEIADQLRKTAAERRAANELTPSP
jgi:nucleotide-binding universal stress UspA family protein